MNDLPKYYLGPIKCPRMPPHKMSDLNERDPARAVNEWQNLPAGQPNSDKVQRNMMKLVMARYSQVDPVHYSTILGVGQANAEQLENAMKKSVDTITTNWIGSPSWLQAFVEGETCWSDYQVIINNLHRMSKMLKLIPEGETAQNRASRLLRREAYKKALRVHQEHVRLGVEAEIQTAEDHIEDLSTKDGVTQVELQSARDQLNFLRGHVEGIIPTTCNVVRTIEDAGEKGTMYCALLENEQVAYWNARWTDDVFVSFLWEFSGVLHFGANWADNAMRNMFYEKFAYCADLIVQYILVPRRITAACVNSSTMSMLRATVKVPEERNTAYAEYRRADQDLEIAVGDQWQLWVQGSPNQKHRTRKRARDDAEDDGMVRRGPGGFREALARGRAGRQ